MAEPQRWTELLADSDDICRRFWSEAVSSGAGWPDQCADQWKTSIDEVTDALAGFAHQTGEEGPPPNEPASSLRVLGRGLAVRFSPLLGLDAFLQHLQLLRTCFLVPVADAGGYPPLVLSFFDLLTRAVVREWRRHESAGLQRRLREANHFILLEKRRYFSIFNQMCEPALILDQRLRIVDANPAFERFAAIRREELLGKSCREVLGEPGKVCTTIERFFAARASFANIETQMVINEEFRDVVLAGSFLGEVAAGQSATLVILQDVSGKKEFERRLLESERKYRSLIENVPNVIWQGDEHGTITYISPNVSNLVGYTGEEVQLAGRLGWLGRIYQEDIDQVINHFARIFTTGHNIDVCYRFQRKDGTWIWLQDRTGIPYHKDGRLLVDGVLSDVTRLKLVEEELEQHHLRLAEIIDRRTEELRTANERLTLEVEERAKTEESLRQLAVQLQASNVELEQFARVASHDLKEPLMLIAAFADRLVRKYAASIDADGQRYLGRITACCDRMQQLIGDLLQLSRISMAPLTVQEIDLGTLVAEVVRDLRDRGSDQAVIRVHTLHNLEGDRTQFWQLFQNLLANALKYRDKTRTPDIVVKSRTLADNLCEISVEDNGIGFDERHLERIFQPFERLHAGEGYEGTGIGLATCRKIVLRHHGEITARSVPGRGSTFIVRLPLRQTGISVCGEEHEKL
ncbi:MAG: ATP-binding protein [Thermodesulfobacteriota bacterium]